MKYSDISKEIKHEIPITNKNFNKIVNFYLMECPVVGKSYRGKSFYEKGWRGTSQFAKLKKEMLDSAETELSKNYYPSNKCELTENFKKCENISSEYCVFLKYEERTVLPSLFSAIRNSLAHGSFDVRRCNGTNVYFFANYKHYLKAKIILYEKTLLNWIDVFNFIDKYYTK